MDQSSDAPSIGIDLGTTYSCVGVWEKDHVTIIENSIGRKTTPSWVAFTDKSRFVGEEAVKQSARNPSRTIYDVKRLMGKSFADPSVTSEIKRLHYQVGQDEHGYANIRIPKQDGSTVPYRPEQISALILTEMKDIAEAYLQKRVSDAVITVPAYFSDSQRTATLRAAKLAGLNCLRIINEPTAACLCYNLEKEANGYVLVFDLGGGTFDVSLVEILDNTLEVAAISGNSHLGGEDFDNLLVDHLLRQLESKVATDANPTIAKSVVAKFRANPKKMRRLKAKAEAAKKTLSKTRSCTVTMESVYDENDYDIVVLRSKFNQLCDQLFQQCMIAVDDALSQAEIEADNVTQVVLVGGSSRIPKIQELLGEKFCAKIINKTINQDEAVAYGAAVQAANLSKDSTIRSKKIQLIDVVPLPIGIVTHNGLMSTLIDRNESIPITGEKIYTTTKDRQTSVEIEVRQGMREFGEDNYYLGKFSLHGLIPEPRGVGKVKVSAMIDENGVLKMIAEDKRTGNVSEMEISADSSRPDDEAVAQMVRDAEEFRAEDQLRKNALIARQRFDEFLEKTLQVINNQKLIVDDMGEPLFTPEEMAYINKYIINGVEWLTEHRDASKEEVEKAKDSMESTLKPYLSRVWTRQKQVRLQEMSTRKAKAKRVDLTDQEVITETFGEDSSSDKVFNLQKMYEGELDDLAEQPVRKSVKKLHKLSMTTK